MSARALLSAVAPALAAVALAFGAGAASAGTWMQVSCVNPDGSAATSEGWTSYSTGTPGYGSSNSANCGPGSPMFASLGATNPEAVGTAEVLQYTPPAGSTLIGGTMSFSVRAEGGGTNASGDAVFYEPEYKYPDDVFYQCAEGLGPCSSAGASASGTINLPASRGGSLYAAATCGGNAGASCTTGDSARNVASVTISGAHLLLSDSAVPEAANITGTALGPRVTGTAHLLMTATDANGPGIYAVTVVIGKRVVYSGTPNTNGGACVPVGTDPASGALMFGHAQPCPAIEQITVPVPTGALSDGRHELTATLIDAAGNPASVVDRYITTSNPQLTPAPRGRHRVHMRFKIKWRFEKAVTRALRIWTERAPRRGRVSVRCVGRRCPRLKIRSGPPRHLRRVISELVHTRFRAGQRLRITVTSPHLRAERIELRIRYGRKPAARLLR